MKNRLLIFTAVCALAFGLGVRAQDAKKDEPETELGQKMEKMSGAFRALRRQAGDASKNADSIAKVQALRQNAQAAIKLEPAKKSEIPAADQAKFVADYQAKMKELIELTNKLEAAFKANNNEEAQKILGTMGDAQKAGHKQFKKADKKKG